MRNFELLPKIIYGRGKYLLIRNTGKDHSVFPLLALHINKNEVTEGQAHYGLISTLWKFGFNGRAPTRFYQFHEIPYLLI